MSARREYECPFCGRVAWMEIGPAEHVEDDGAFMRIQCIVIECICGATRAWEPEEYADQESV